MNVHKFISIKYQLGIPTYIFSISIKYYLIEIENKSPY